MQNETGEKKQDGRLPEDHPCRAISLEDYDRNRRESKAERQDDPHAEWTWVEVRSDHGKVESDENGKLSRLDPAWEMRSYGEHEAEGGYRQRWEVAMQDLALAREAADGGAEKAAVLERRIAEYKALNESLLDDNAILKWEAESASQETVRLRERLEVALRGTDNAAALERKLVLAEDSHEHYRRSMEAECENLSEILGGPMSVGHIREVREVLDNARELRKENKRLNQIIGVGALRKIENLREQVKQREQNAETLKEENGRLVAELQRGSDLLASTWEAAADRVRELEDEARSSEIFSLLTSFFPPEGHVVDLPRFTELVSTANPYQRQIEEELKAEREQLARVSGRADALERQRDEAFELYAEVLDKLEAANGDLERKEPYIKYLQKAHGGAVDRCRSYHRTICELKQELAGVASGVIVVEGRDYEIAPGHRYRLVRFANPTKGERLAPIAVHVDEPPASGITPLLDHFNPETGLPRAGDQR